MFYLSFSPGRAKTLDSNPSDILANLIDSFEPEQIIVISLSHDAIWNNQDYKLYHWPGDIFLPYLSELSGFQKSESIDFHGTGINLLVFNRVQKL